MSLKKEFIEYSTEIKNKMIEATCSTSFIYVFPLKESQ